MSNTIFICCPTCHKMNRLPADKQQESPHCGVCKADLFQHTVTELDATHFESHVIKSDVPILVDFMENKCNPCRVMKPVFQQIAERMEPKVRVARINTDEFPDFKIRYSLPNIPTFILFNKGKELGRFDGTLPFPGLLQWIEEHLPESP